MFSARASRSTRAPLSSTGGRPGERCGYVQRLATSRRCQRRQRLRTHQEHMPGPPRQNPAERAQKQPVMRVNAGLGTCRRRIETSCRSTTISKSFEASPRHEQHKQTPARDKRRDTRATPTRPPKGRAADATELPTPMLSPTRGRLVKQSESVPGIGCPSILPPERTREPVLLTR